ncbi:MAG TPA: hypothetical protein VIK13_00225 [Candidatus Limnocylindrales bacterium]
MRYGRIGGGLVVGGWGLLVAGMALSWVAGSVVGGATMSASLAVVGCGAALLAIKGPAPLRGRAVRVGLGIMAAGLLGVAGSSIAAARLTYDPLEDMPTVVLLLGGGLLLFVGMLVTQLSLIRAGGLARRLGALFFAGLGGIYLMESLAALSPDSVPLQLITGALALVGGAGFLVGCAGPGLLALRGDRATVTASA